VSAQVDLAVIPDCPRTTPEQRRAASLTAARYCLALPGLDREQRRAELGWLLEVLLKEPRKRRAS
jgi:hypothetical protein